METYFFNNGSKFIFLCELMNKENVFKIYSNNGGYSQLGGGDEINIDNELIKNNLGYLFYYYSNKNCNSNEHNQTFNYNNNNDMTEKIIDNSYITNYISNNLTKEKDESYNITDITDIISENVISNSYITNYVSNNLAKEEYISYNVTDVISEQIISNSYIENYVSSNLANEEEDELHNKTDGILEKKIDISFITNFVSININKEDDILYNIKDIFKDKVPGQTYTIKGKDYTISIKPANSTMEPNTTYIKFSECESILRNHYNISNTSFVTLLQIELYNNNSKSLINQVEYQAYGDNFTILNLDLCKDANIQIFYSIKDDILLDIEMINYLKNLGFDVFNINDSFFWDVCQPYSNSENDLILEDRIKDLYQNYSLCEEGCTYNNISLENMTVLCDCKIKENITTVVSEINLDKIKYETTSNFDIIKCYDIIFKFKLKMTNIGFWIFTILNISHFPLLFHYCYTEIKPVYDFVINEMIKFGYLNKNINNINNDKKGKKVKSIINKKKKFGKKKMKKKENSNDNPPRKNKKNNKNQGNNPIIKNFMFIKNNIIEKSRTKIIKINDNDSKRKLKKRKYKTQKMKKNIINISKNDNSNYIMNKKNKKLGLSNQETINPNDKSKNKSKNIIDFPLITINLNKINKNDYCPSNSYRILNIYSFEEAIKYDQRSICEIFFIYLLSKQAIFHAFFFKSPFELFSLRLCLLFFIFSCDLALNAFFYFNDNISKKYKYAKSLFLFTFNNNLNVILLSTFVGFVLLTLFIKLSNSTFALREIFRNEEEKMKKDNKYKVTEKRKMEIKNEIEKIFKNYKIKIIIFVLVELLFMIFFWYFVTIFCHVYPSTQTSWLFDSFLSMISRIIIDALICFGLAKLYRIAVDSNINCIYKFAMFLYGF